MISLPIHKITYPACLQGQPNGRLGSDLLVDTLGLDGGPIVRLVAPAALAWRALTAAATLDGITLKATSLLDSYRPYSIQERIFLQRYTTTRLPGRPARTWEGVTYWQKPGTAAAAVPGTSNHGLGLAVDVGTELDGDAGTEAVDRKALAWLLAHAADFGWSWELQSEPWHLRYVAGDALIAPPEDDMPRYKDWPLEDKMLLAADVAAAVIERLGEDVPTTKAAERLKKAAHAAQHLHDHAGLKD